MKRLQFIINFFVICLFLSVGTTIIKAQDSDGDGIANTSDLDDDNDGIQDNLECPESFNTFLNYHNTGSYAATYPSPSNISTAFNSTAGSGLSRILTSNNYQELSNISALDESQAIINNEYVEYAFTTNNKYAFINKLGYYATFSAFDNTQYHFSARISKDNFSTNTLLNTDYAYVPGALDFEIPVYQYNYSLEPNTTYKIRIYFYAVNGGASATIAHDDFKVIGFVECDNDGDLIPNRIDLDSDNDGCLDAIEGDENVATAQLVNAAGTVTVGTGSSAPNQNLCASSGCVDTDGVPVVVNVGAAADIGGDQGQGVGTSANSAIQDTQCLTGFGCTTNLYLSQTNTLYNVGTSTNPFTYTQIGTPAALNYNAIGINPLDGFMYGIIANTNTMIRINADGTYNTLGTVIGLPNGVSYSAGEIDNMGNYYVKINTNNNQLYRIDLTTMTATLITLSASVNLPDIAYSVTAGLLFGVNSTNGQLVSINPITGAVVPIGITPGAVNFGAMFASSTGEMYGVSNTGGFYQFNPTTGQRVLISNAPASSGNDGAHCVTSPITFSADLYVTKTDGTPNYTPGTTTTYTIVAGNNGPFGVLNANISDLVPAGIPAANVTYTATASSGSSTTVTGTQTGAINDLVSLPVGGAVTYTVSIVIPAGFTGNLTNTVTITAPSATSDPVSANNTATDTDMALCYKPAITAGTALDTKHGITALGRAGVNIGNWPMVRKGAWTALESKTKGFVINRIPTTAQVNAIANPVEGMMVYDEEADCLKIYTTTDNGATFSWLCFNSQTCPN